jgi:hypothetical protein
VLDPVIISTRLVVPVGASMSHPKMVSLVVLAFETG